MTGRQFAHDAESLPMIILNAANVEQRQAAIDHHSFIIPHQRLSLPSSFDELEHVTLTGIGLREHGGRCLGKDLVLGEIGCLG